MNILPRRQARETALAYLFSLCPPANTRNQEALQNFAVDLSFNQFLEFCKAFSLDQDDYAWKLIIGTRKNTPELDAGIQRISANWRLERMPPLDLTLIRMAAYEILFDPEIPKSVAINEALELGKRFGSEDSAAFLNGILDKLDKAS